MLVSNTGAANISRLGTHNQAFTTYNVLFRGKNETKYLNQTKRQPL